MPQKKTKIALYIPSLRGGGAERVFVILANDFAKRGYEVHLVLVSSDGPYLKDVCDDVRVINLNKSRVFASLFPLVSYLRSEKPTVLLSAMSHANIVALFAKKLSLAPTRVVVSERSYLSVSLAYSRSFKVGFIVWVMRLLYRSADGIIAISSGVADDLALHANMPRDQIAVVYNPVDIERIKNLASYPLDVDLKREEGVPLILAAGRFSEIKDFSTLLKAFSRYLEKNHGKLCIIGDGHLRDKLKSEITELGISKYVTMPGFLNNPFPAMRNADLFVLSSAAEAFGNVLVEAMACGTPIVSTDCPSGPGEILENGRWGRLVPVHDEAALADAIAASLEDDDQPDMTIRAADFSVDRAVEGYLRVLMPSEMSPPHS